MLVALDDTDGPNGGCTTYLAGEILDRLGHDHQAGRPRLVRLRPENPYKTRGNAGIALPLDDALDPRDVLEAVMDVVRAHARIAEGKGAGVAVFETRPEPAWYERGVREQIPLAAAQDALAQVPTATLGNGRGLVGALCAAAWDPDERAHTFTRIAYRAPERWGTPRRVDPSSVKAASDVEATFDCWDPHAEHPVMVPRTPCPVLYGLRATNPEALPEAARPLETEPVARSTTFVTNQATDDHLHPERIEPVTVTETPTTLEGGHVRVPAETEDGRAIDLMAFEPTGRLRHGVLTLEPGDRVVGLGTVEPDQINLEKALIVPGPRRVATRCPSCGGRMRSTGREGPRRCPRCGTRQATETRTPDPTWVEADASARRHLARPLALGLADHVEAATERAGLQAHPVAGTASTGADPALPR